MGQGLPCFRRSMPARLFPTRRLVHVLPAWRAPDSIVHTVFTSRRGMAPATRAFVEYVAKELRPRLSG